MTFKPLRLLQRAAFVLAAFCSTMAHAQYTSDIDIYAGISSANSAPNVLIIVDNTANWNTAN